MIPEKREQRRRESGVSVAGRGWLVPTLPPPEATDAPWEQACCSDTAHASDEGMEREGKGTECEGELTGDEGDLAGSVLLGSEGSAESGASGGVGDRLRSSVLARLAGRRRSRVEISGRHLRRRHQKG